MNRTTCAWLLAVVTAAGTVVVPAAPVNAEERAKDGRDVRAVARTVADNEARRVKPERSRPQPPPPATAPANLTATLVSGRVMLTWSAVAGATGYQVFRSTDNTWAAPPIETTHRTGFRDRLLTNGVTYFYRVAAFNRAGPGPMSDVVSTTVVVPPSAPTGLMAAAGNASITLSWTPVTGATGYNVYRGGAAGAEGATPIATNVAAATFLDSGLVNGTPYFYKVTAIGPGGESTRSAEATATPTAPLGAPTNLNATPGNAMITLSWTPVSGATGYNVYRGGAAGAEGATPIATNVATSAFVDSGLVNGTPYFYKVTALGSGGESARSTEATATPTAPLTAPTNLTATAGNTTVTLGWTPVTGATSYTVYRGTASGAEATTPVATGLTSPTFGDTGLTNGLTYFYQVTAATTGSESARSMEASATPLAPVIANPTLEAFRFLRQASWGPKPGDVAALAPLGAAGRDAYITQQFGATPSIYPDTLFVEPIDIAQEYFMALALTGEDQLRQRVAWALHKIWVVSAVEVPNTRGILTYHRLFQNGAFGNYRDLMFNVTVNPAMGKYLTMLNNKSVAKTGFPANENFAREIMQLFTLGLAQLNPNGTPVNPPGPTFTEDDVKALARILTGWTYGDGNPGTIPAGTGSENFGVPMEPVSVAAGWHDVTAKTFLGQTFAAGGTALAELNLALDTIFGQPSLAPFVSRQLIQQLVTSNPSPAYVSAVAAVFTNNGSGVRGDLAAVVRAILTHPEALASGDPMTMGGKLAEPVLYISSMMRAFNANVTDHPYNTMRAEAMGQRVFYPPSVFSYFSPGFRVRGTNNGSGVPLLGPEFQGLTSVTALERANYVSDLLAGRFGTNVTIDYSPFTSRAADAAALTDYCAEVFMGTRMSTEMRNAIITAVNASAVTNLTDRANTAIYLTLTAAQAQVDR